MENVLERHRLPKFTQDEIEYINNSVSVKKIEFIIKKKPSAKENYYSPIWLYCEFF